jgi:hypothetical protein
MEPLQIYAALFTTVFFNSLITGAIVCHYYDKTIKAILLRGYQQGNWQPEYYSDKIALTGSLAAIPDDPTHPNRLKRDPIPPDSLAYDEIFKSVRGKC